MVEQNTSFKSSAIEKNLIRPSRFLTFKERYLWDMPIVPLGNKSFVCMNVHCLSGTINNDFDTMEIFYHPILSRGEFSTLLGVSARWSNTA